MGRSVSQTRTRQRIYLAALAAGNTRKAASALAGVSRETPYKWAERSLAFGLEVAGAEAEFQDRCIRRIEQAAARGSWAADAWLLSHRYPDEFGERSQLKLEVTADEQVAVDQIKRFQTMSLAEKEAEIAELRALRDDGQPALLEAHAIEPKDAEAAAPVLAAPMPVLANPTSADDDDGPAIVVERRRPAARRRVGPWDGPDDSIRMTRAGQPN